MWNPFKKKPIELEDELSPWRLDYRLIRAEYLIKVLIEGIGEEQFNRGKELLEEKTQAIEKIIEDHEAKILSNIKKKASK